MSRVELIISEVTLECILIQAKPSMLFLLQKRSSAFACSRFSPFSISTKLVCIFCGPMFWILFSDLVINMIIKFHLNFNLLWWWLVALTKLSCTHWKQYLFGVPKKCTNTCLVQRVICRLGKYEHLHIDTISCVFRESYSDS